MYRKVLDVPVPAAYMLVFIDLFESYWIRLDPDFVNSGQFCFSSRLTALAIWMESSFAKSGSGSDIETMAIGIAFRPNLEKGKSALTFLPTVVL